MNGMARMEIAVYPLGTGDTSISREVAHILPVLDRCGLVYETTVVGTVVEGTPGQLFTLARDMHESVASRTGRVITTIRIDDRRDA